METQKNIDTLNGLISILDDGKVGYTNAAENCEDNQLKSEFLSLARDRALMIVELQDEINKLGKSTDASDGPLGAIHRAWIDFKSLVTGNDNEAIINACITGEEYAIEKFKESLGEENLSFTLNTLVASQLLKIENALFKIKSYKKIAL